MNLKMKKNILKKCEQEKNLFNLKALVSTKITKEEYKVGFMVRYKPYKDEDSGWQFFAGNEDDKYLNDIKNIELLPLAYVSNLDSDILKYIDRPIGTVLIRISSNEFELDKHNKEIYVEKRDIIDSCKDEK